MEKKFVKIDKELLKNTEYKVEFKVSEYPKYYCMECGVIIYEDDNNFCYNICNSCRNLVC